MCLGNICRSATAEEIMRTYVRKAGLADRIEIDSAGKSSSHRNVHSEVSTHKDGK